MEIVPATSYHSYQYKNSGQYNSILSRVIHYFCLSNPPIYKSEQILDYLYRLTTYYADRYESTHSINYAVNYYATWSMCNVHFQDFSFNQFHLLFNIQPIPFSNLCHILGWNTYNIFVVLRVTRGSRYFLYIYIRKSTNSQPI